MDDPRRGRRLEELRRIALREPQRPANAVKMRIQRKDQARSLHRFPPARVHVVAADQPPQHQVQPLARAAPRGVGQKVPALAGGSLADGVGERSGGRGHRLVVPAQARQEALLQAAVFPGGCRGRGSTSRPRCVCPRSPGSSPWPRWSAGILRRNPTIPSSPRSPRRSRCCFCFRDWRRCTPCRVWRPAVPR